MYKVLKRTCCAIVLPMSSFALPCPRCRRRRGLLKVPNLLAWRELFANLHELKARVLFWKEYNHFERIYTVYRFDRFSSNFAKTSKE